MTDAYDAAIENLKKEISDRMKLVNNLLSLKGEPPIFPDPESAIGSGVRKIRSDLWYTSGLSTAAREFLNMRRENQHGPASLDEIYNALVAGGFKFETKDESTAKPALKQSLTKNTAVFHRLPNGLYGLAEWYPGRKNEDEATAKKKPSTGRHVKPANRIATRKDKARTVATVTIATSLADYVREAIRAMDSEFTKREVYEWLVKNKPESGVAARRDSVFSMINYLKDDMHLETAESEIGKQSKYRVATNGKH